MYLKSLNDMKTLLVDTRNYINHHFYSTGEKSITYHCWFFYEIVQEMLKDAQQKFLNKRYVERHLSHPFNILQYYQPDNNGRPSTLDIPVELKTHFQLYGSVYEDQPGKQQKQVNAQTFAQIKNTIHSFILARFMVYKWIGPFNEMYIKLKEQFKKKEDEIILIELFDDLFAETYREDSLSKKRR